MSKCKWLFSFLIIASGTNIGEAQTISTAVSGHYTPSVICKVYEVVSLVDLSEQIQIALAQHYTRTDSIMSLLVLQTNAAGEINRLQAASMLELKKILGDDKWNAYSNLLIASEKTSPAYEMRVHNYLQTMLDWLNKIKPLPEETIKNIRLQYNDVVRQRIDRSYTELFRDVLRRNVLDTVYYVTLYASEIRQNAEFNTAAACYVMAAKQKIPMDVITQVKPLIETREKRLATCYYAASGYYAAYHDSIARRVRTCYDSLINNILLDNGCSPDDQSQLAFALKYKDLLGITPKQIEVIRTNNRLIKKQENEIAAMYSHRMAENRTNVTTAELLDSLLTEKQYLDLLDIYNVFKARACALKDWKKLKEFDLTEYTSDSTQTVTDLHMYYMDRMAFSLRYASIRRTTPYYVGDIMPPPSLRRLVEECKRRKVEIPHRLYFDQLRGL